MSDLIKSIVLIADRSTEHIYKDIDPICQRCTLIEPSSSSIEICFSCVFNPYKTNIHVQAYSHVRHTLNQLRNRKQS